MLFKTVQSMIEWLRKQAILLDQSAHDADYHNNNTPWVGQTNPNTGVYVDYQTVNYEEGIRLHECADMLGSLNVIANPIINKVESDTEEDYNQFSEEEGEEIMSNWHTEYFNTIIEAQIFYGEVEKNHGCANLPVFVCDKNKYGVSYTYD